MHTDCLHTGSVTMTKADGVRKKDKGKLRIEQSLWYPTLYFEVQRIERKWHRTWHKIWRSLSIYRWVLAHL